MARLPVMMTEVRSTRYKDDRLAAGFMQPDAGDAESGDKKRKTHDRGLVVQPSFPDGLICSLELLIAASPPRPKAV